MGLLDILNGMQNGPRGPADPNDKSGGMSKLTMAILALLAYWGWRAAMRQWNMPMVVLNLRAPSVLLGFQVGGIVGHKFLSSYRVSMDMARSELRMEKF